MFACYVLGQVTYRDCLYLWVVRQVATWFEARKIPFGVIWSKYLDNKWASTNK